MEFALMIAQGVQFGYVGAKKAYKTIKWLEKNGYLGNNDADDLEDTVDEQGGIDSEQILVRVHKCSICHATGHNCRTCPDR
jgi:hypothetical protein